MSLRKKLTHIILYIFRIFKETIPELYQYYLSPFPIRLVLGAIKRIKRRFKILFISRGPGRPPISEDLVDLIINMKMANMLWGALRISQELKLLGIRVHKKTIQRILNEYGLVPPRNYNKITWKSFFKSFKYSWSLDFTTVFDCRGFQLYILNIINQATRELVLTNCTYHPNRLWITQQFKNIAIDDIAFPKQLIIGNDQIFGKWMIPIFKEFFGISVKKIPPNSPNFNPYIERFHRSMKDEVLNKIHIVNDHQIRVITNQYRNYYNNERPHQGLMGKIPSANFQNNVHPMKDIKNKIIKRPYLDGLIVGFKLAA